MSKVNGKATGEKRTIRRCAIYTRKSTEEGLQQEFNSLDAQRESGEAYIAAQKHEGWVCLPDRYDDGGFTGGNMDRPAVHRLMKDIEAGKVDCVVVYKVDRLSRSLMDFARIMEAFEKHQTSFVSVTQQFNTSTSMGRLMLNVLLSFAQFEREIISERTRDKIAAARRKGKFAGGKPVLGYNLLSSPAGPKLVVNDDEAAQVRAIFELYLKYEALIPMVVELDRRGWTTKVWQTKDGRRVGGRPFDKNMLYHLLTNVVYLGKVRYRDEVHPGEHPAIVDEARRTAQGPAPMRSLQMLDGPRLHGAGHKALPLLRLPACPETRLAQLPDQVGARWRDRAVRRRTDQRHWQRPHRSGRDATPGAGPRPTLPGRVGGRRTGPRAGTCPPQRGTSETGLQRAER
jgi:DNA invertase Pin-like site-specific DNA recombinase